MNKRRVSGLCWIVLKGPPMFFMLAAIIVFAAPFAALAGPGEYLPAYIYGMEQKKVISGKEASRIINRMHQGDVATNFNYIAEYMSEAGSATYYLSIYAHPEQAVKAMEDMARVMKEEGHGFSHFMQRVQNGNVFYMALGQGQAHYFFARNVELVWLAVDKKIAEQAIMEVLHGS